MRYAWAFPGFCFGVGITLIVLSVLLQGKCVV